VVFPVSCAPEAQRRFERAMAVLHSFWWDEGPHAFGAVLEADSTCAMAHWGLALNAWGNPFAGGPTRPLFVTDPGLAAMPMVGKVVDDVKRAGLDIAIFSDVRANPVEANVIAGVRAYQAGDHDGVVAFGGGSGSTSASWLP